MTHTRTPGAGADLSNFLPSPGPIPASFEGLASITEISLSYNKLSGPVPDFLGGLSRLESLLLGSNRLEGAIPACLGQLTRLTSL
jgi:Leucine-rich repeat (LRR) protein